MELEEVAMRKISRSSSRTFWGMELGFLDLSRVSRPIIFSRLCRGFPTSTDTTLVLIYGNPVPRL